jgi:hypothetical protein
MTYGEKELSTQLRDLRINMYPLWEEMLHRAGTTKDMDDQVVHALIKFSEEYSFEGKAGTDTEGLGTSGVAKERKIFHDPLQIFLQIPSLMDRYEKSIRASFKDSISREKFVELVENTGLDQADLRSWRRHFPKLFHSEYACDIETKELNKNADALLGEPIVITPAVIRCTCFEKSPATVKVIQAALIKKNLSTVGNKSKLIERLREVDPTAFQLKCTCDKQQNQPFAFIDFKKALIALLPTALMSSLQPDDREQSDIIGEAEEAHKRLTEELASMNPEELPYPT